MDPPLRRALSNGRSIFETWETPPQVIHGPKSVRSFPNYKGYWLSKIRMIEYMALSASFD